MRIVLTLLFTPLLGLAVEPVSLKGELLSVPLLTSSKNQPAMAVLVGDTLFYSEGKNLESSKEEDCPAIDLYRYNLTEKRETRIAELKCVLTLITEGQTTYVVTKSDQNDIAVGRLIDGKTLQLAPLDSTARMRSRVAFKRSTLKLPRGPEIKHVGYALRENELNGVFQSEGHVFFDSVVFDKPTQHSVLAVSMKGNLSTQFALSQGTILFSLRKGNEGWFRMMETTHSGVSALLGHERPLDKNWTEVGHLDWSVRAPHYLTAIPDGFLIADRSPHAFSEATAVSWYSKTAERFFRLAIPDQDVGGLSYVLGGVLVSKPMSGSIVWYGKKNPFKNEEKK